MRNHHGYLGPSMDLEWRNKNKNIHHHHHSYVARYFFIKSNINAAFSFENVDNNGSSILRNVNEGRRDSAKKGVVNDWRQ